MSGPVATLLSDGCRLHLQHGPIDLIIGADGARKASFAAARQRFSTILQELVDELPVLRQPVGTPLQLRGETARLMQSATQPFADMFVTPMASVAGAVADTVLAAMCRHPVRRAYVNNGGDIALWLATGERFDLAMAGANGSDLGRIVLHSEDGIGGVATSGRHGRSLSMGIADSVTILARTAAQADAAATLIANAVDLPGHPAVIRCPANTLVDDSDLGARLVVTEVGDLGAAQISQALQSGVRRARMMMDAGKIAGAALMLRGETELIGAAATGAARQERIVQHA